MKTFVITNPELGWDCVVGIFQAKSLDALMTYLKEDEKWSQETLDQHVIHEQVITIIP